MSIMVDEKIFSFAYKMAFRDATMRKAFPRLDGENSDDFSKRKYDVMDIAKQPVQEYIKKIFAGAHPNPLKTITTICERTNQLNFSFGNAQKLVNMTAKYMFISTYGDEKKRNLFSDCECPMDSVMIGILRKKCPKTSLKVNVSWSRLPWDKDNIPKEYKVFQDGIREMLEEGKLPIEADYLYWDE